jgi:NAD(P)-dependent dehydrogenase (short-subunit alcohol dehydrogenase family)
MSDEPRFDGRTALVTGAARGLGRAYAELLAERGARVVLNDIDADEAHSTAGALGIACAVGDVSTEAGARAVVAGAGAVDIVIANAGVSWHRDFADLTTEEYDHCLRHNLSSTVHVVRACWAGMIERSYGRVVTTASGGMFGIAGRSHYVAAKGGVWALTATLALEGRPHGIHVNCVLPWAHTRLARPGSAAPPAHEAAAAVAWLCHDDCTITGEGFAVGGGKVARVVMQRGRPVVADPTSIAAQRDAFAALFAD